MELPDPNDIYVYRDGKVRERIALHSMYMYRKNRFFKMYIPVEGLFAEGRFRVNPTPIRYR